MSSFELYTYKNYTVKILTDECSDNPRNWDNLGTIATWHRYYSLGDVQPKIKPSEWLKEQGKGLYLPVYMYEHSGITINTTPFSCSFDSGQLGYIFVSNEKIRKEFAVKRITKKIAANVLEILESEIKMYNQYLIGDVYYYDILDNSGESVDNCGGFYGLDDAVQAANESIDFLEKQSLPLFVAGGLI